MSHIVQIRTQVRDPVAIDAACKRLGLNAPSQQTVRLFTTNATGYAVQLPEWKYPVVCDLRTGQMAFDNFEGHWGDQQHLNCFLQHYAVEKAKIEARRQGHSVVEQPLSDGSIKLTIEVGGAA